MSYILHIFILFPSQVQTVVPGISVEAVKLSMTVEELRPCFYTMHCIIGIVNPSAMQYNCNFSPTLTMCVYI